MIPDLISEIVLKIMKNRHRILDEFAIAYIAKFFSDKELRNPNLLKTIELVGRPEGYFR